MNDRSATWVLMVAFSLVFLSIDTRAEITCTNSDYRGTYAFYATGSLINLPPEAAPLLGPFAQAGTFTGDGLGNVVIETTPSYNGFVFPSAEVGTYHVSPDCTVTFDVVLPLVEVPSIFFGVLGLNNRYYNLTVTDPPGTSIVGQHFKQDLRFCGPSDFSGAYQIDLTGYRVAPLGQAGPFLRSGRLVADGDGHFAASTVANYAGAIVSEELEGTYSVSARCGLEIRYNSGGQEFQWTGNLVGRGERAAVMVAVPGWAVAGMLRGQQ